ncbi:MAG: DUF4835 family protein [Bacteroidetes bacterium]|nr:DUF4835 family protein [Rhodothermia bacterium]MCX7906641.1 DUF4835 family protein [Bacteroidota bacterium]MDW8285051.1 DUF4835 family protein [Bacteroidota bacterium]
MRYIGSCLLGMSLILWGGQAAAQELSCTVSIELRALEGTGVEFLRQLKPQIEEYLNQHRWTEDLFELQERIECALQIVFVQRDGDQYTAQLAVTSRRPIYGSDQQTVVLQLVEPRWSFRYVQGQPLVHNLEQFDELTSTLDFYAYLILGYDYDTFSPQGGTRFLEIARRIVDLAQRGGGAQQWRPSGERNNRYWLISQLLDARFTPFREALFLYHFRGLDAYLQNPESARERILEALERIYEVFQDASRQYVLDLFFTAKYRELVAALEEAPVALRRRAYEILSAVDPGHSSEYRKLLTRP